MRADHSHDDDPVQVCVSLYPPARTHTIHSPHDRTSHYTWAPHGVPHHLYLHVTRPKHPSSSPHPPSLPLLPGATETGIQTHSTSFLSRYLLILHRNHPRRSTRKSRRHTTQFIARVFFTVPPARHTQIRLRPSEAADPQAQSPVVRKGGSTRDNSGSNELMHVLQNTFESNRYGPGSTNTSQREKRRKKRRRSWWSATMRTKKRVRRRRSKPTCLLYSTRRWPRRSHSTPRVRT